MIKETFLRLIKLGFTNFWRNRWLSLAATLIMALTLFIMSAFVIINIAISSTTNFLKSKIDLVVSFNDQPSDSQILDLKSLLETRSDVLSVKYLPKEEAYQRWLNLNTPEKIKNLITPEENPLPRSLEIKARDPENLEGVATFLAQDNYKNIIRSISYQRNKDIIQKLINLTNFSKKLGFALSIIFIAIAILVILNTIRLTIFTRRDEIEIMRLVGAADYFIKLPFLLEAIFYSLFACVISALLLGLTLYLVTPFFVRYLDEVPLDLMNFFWRNLGWIVLSQLLVGVLISSLCSLVSVRRHIRI